MYKSNVDIFSPTQVYANEEPSEEYASSSRDNPESYHNNPTGGKFNDKKSSPNSNTMKSHFNVSEVYSLNSYEL